jgi:hypothetical protein
LDTTVSAPVITSITTEEPSLPLITKSTRKPTTKKQIPAKQNHDLSATPNIATSPQPTPPAQEVSVSGPSHMAWDSLLQKHVTPTGKVNYKGFKTDQTALTAYCDLLAQAIPDSTWSREAQMAYWINAYNAFTIKLIVDNYPATSILKFDGGKTWDVKRIRLANKKYSLNQIENDILRPRYKDARIHFAINCAAKSCPPLHHRAYTAENLEKILEERTRSFINATDYNSISATKAQVSKIFEWYAVDFGDLRSFLNQYSNTQLNKNAVIRYQEYNWDLND